MKQFLAAGLSLLRGVTGDDAYEKYLDHHRRSHPDLPPVAPDVFFKTQLEQKWNCVSGCC